MTFKKRTWFYRGYFGLVRGRISEFRDYILEIESKFQHDQKTLEKKCDDEIRRRGADAELAQDIIDYYADEFHIIDRIFLQTFRYATVVSIYTLLVTAMDSLCQHLQKTKGFNIELTDIKGDGIERAKLYLVKVCGVSFPDSIHEWAEIQKLNKIRNCIVHADGNIERVHSPKKLKNIVKTTKGVMIEGKRNLSIEREYLENSITWVGDFLHELYEKSLPEQ